VFGVLGEDKSDVATLKVLMRRIADDKGLTIHGKGYEGCSEMLRKGATQLRLFSDTHGCKKFVVCYDRDKGDVDERRKEVIDEIIVPSGLNAEFCIVIPIEEIEAWILADLVSVTKIFTGWRPDKDFVNPEGEKDPKELVEKLSRMANGKPRYDHATHNEKVAQHVSLDTVAKKCPSFVPLVKFVKEGKANYT
jgi:hypothetical protein